MTIGVCSFVRAVINGVSSCGSLSQGGGGEPEPEPVFSPLDFFTDTQAGGWYDFTDSTKLWTDTAGTTQVASDGDAIARVDDKSGNNLHLLQPTLARRPIYRESGGKSWAEFIRTNNHWMSNTDISNVYRNIGAGIIGMALRDVFQVQGGQLFNFTEMLDSGSGLRHLVRSNPSTNTLSVLGKRLESDGLDEFTPAGTFGTGSASIIVHTDYANSRIDSYVDGVVTSDENYQTDGNTSDTACNGFSLGGANGGAGVNFATMDVYHFVVVGDASYTPEQIADLETFFQTTITG